MKMTKIATFFSMLVLLHASAVQADITHNIISNGDGSALSGWQLDPDYVYDNYGSALRVGFDNNTNSETTISNGEVMGIPYFAIGQGTDARGEITITGAGTEVNFQNTSFAFFMGHNGARSVGILNIEDGAKVNSGIGESWLGNATDSQGTINISGGILESQGLFSIGNQLNSTGVVNIESSATGNGIWTSTTKIIVGNSGNGSLNVGSGGVVNTKYLNVGRNAAGSGSVTIDGGTITITSTSDTDTTCIGKVGTGMVDIINGGILTSHNPVGIGNDADSTGIMNIGSGGTWDAKHFFYVGRSGDGTLNVENGGSVVASNLFILGRASGAEGLITINGGTIEAKHEIRIGQNGGTGIIEITNGGLLKASKSSGLNITMMGSDSKLRLSTGGMFAWIDGDGLTDNSASLNDTELATFFEDDQLQYWAGDELTGGWESLGLATLGMDYTLEYITTTGGEFDGYHVLTVDSVMIPEPSTLTLLLAMLIGLTLTRRRK